MQPPPFPPSRPAAGGRAGSAILLTLITMIVLVGVDLIAWRLQAQKLATHENISIWAAYLGFGVITGLVALLIRSSSAVVPVIGAIVVAAGSFANMFLIFPVISSKYGGPGFSETLKTELERIDDFLESAPTKVYAAIGAGIAIFLVLSLIGLVSGRRRVRRTPVPYGQSPLPYGQNQNLYGGSQPPSPQQGSQTPPPFQPQGGAQTPPPFPGPGLYSPPPYGQPQGPQQYGQPSYGQQSPPPYDPERQPRSPGEPTPYGRQNPPPYGQQNPPPYGQNEPQPPREDAERDEPGPELPPLPPPPR